MRIAVWHNLPSGGGNRALHDQVRGLVGRGHHIEIWCPPSANRTFLPLGEYAREHVLPMDLTAPPDRNPITRRFHPIAAAKFMLAEFDRHCRACAEEINRGGFDVLLAHSSMTFASTPIGRYVDVPSILYLQEPFRPFYEAQPKLVWLAPPARDGQSRVSYWKSSFYDLVHTQSFRLMIREELAAAASFDLILVNSMFSRESVLRSYGLESRVCYLGIDTQAFHPTDAPKERYVVGLGSVITSKRPDLALDALGTIEESARPELVWIGNAADASYAASLEARARDLGVRFRILVNVSHSELIDTLGRASAMLYTSRLEPFGYAPVEANACGTAVVAVAEGGVRESIVDGLSGRLLADADPSELGRAVREFCDDPDKARAVGLAARRNVEQAWSLEASLDRLEAQLDRAASPKALANRGSS
jgi:glycosyltransferase involved in cell wall biosynthesis